MMYRLEWRTVNTLARGLFWCLFPKFMEHCNLLDYADENSMSASAKYVDETTALLKADCKHDVNWLTSNGVIVNAGKFQFMSTSPSGVTDK